MFYKKIVSEAIAIAGVPQRGGRVGMGNGLGGGRSMVGWGWGGRKMNGGDLTFVLSKVVITGIHSLENIADGWLLYRTPFSIGRLSLAPGRHCGHRTEPFPFNPNT